VSTYDVLRYIRSTFDDEAVLNAVPLEAAGNPGAWQAWRTHQRSSGKVFKDDEMAILQAGPVQQPEEIGSRKPGEWNWEHVWEERVKKGIAASLSESVLYGNAGVADDVVSSSLGCHRCKAMTDV